MSHPPDLATVLSSAPPATLAPLLLGARLSRGPVVVRITEVEAYAGQQDPGSHAYRGRTPRSAVMFGPAGRLYVYFVYGMHYCANVVCGPEGTAAALLLRAGEVVAGADQARARRPGAPDRDLARGPARLCRALGVDLGDNGADLDAGRVGSRVRLELAAGTGSSGRVEHGPRVGLREAADVPWRFWLAGEPTVSAYRPASPRRSRPPRRPP